MVFQESKQGIISLLNTLPTEIQIYFVGPELYIIMNSKMFTFLSSIHLTWTVLNRINLGFFISPCLIHARLYIDAFF